MIGWRWWQDNRKGGTAVDRSRNIAGCDRLTARRLQCHFAAGTTALVGSGKCIVGRQDRLRVRTAEVNWPGKRSCCSLKVIERGHRDGKWHAGRATARG